MARLGGTVIAAALWKLWKATHSNYGPDITHTHPKILISMDSTKFTAPSAKCGLVKRKMGSK
jgi:hypothetical protein